MEMTLQEILNYFDNDFWELMDNSCGSLDITMEAVFFIKRHLEVGSNVCDLMCGNARHILALDRLGYNVCGIEINPSLVESVRSTNLLRRDAIDMGDVRSYMLPKNMDCFLILTSSIGYFGKEEDIKLFKRIFKALSKNGKLIIDMPNYDHIVKKFKQRDWQKVGEKYYLFNHVLKGNTKVTDLTIIKNGDIYHKTLKMRLYSIEEIKLMLTECEFSKISIFCDFNVTETNDVITNARRIQIIAAK